jgi:uncharacterized membrane protein
MHKFISSTARLCAVAALAASATAAHATSYSYATFSRPDTLITNLWDVNNSGQMVGYSVATSTSDAQGFMYSGGSFTAITGPAGAISSAALGVSDSGVVVGSYFDSKSIDGDGNVVFGPQRAFIFNGSSYSTFEVAGATFTEARGISSDGRYIAGYYGNDTVTGQGFVLDTTTNSFAFVGAGGLDSFTIMQGVNNSHVAVGSDLDFVTGSRPGIIYDIGTATRTDVLLPGTVRTAFRAIDDFGVMAGWYSSGSGTHGFTGYPGALQTIDAPGANSTLVEGSNNAGILVGTYSIGDQFYSFVATPVPEPETWALMLGGIALLALRRRR